MNHINEEDLLLYHYDELSEVEADEIRSLLKSESSLMAQYNELLVLLNATNEWKPTNVDENFEQRIWHTVEAEINVIDASNKNEVTHTTTTFLKQCSDWFISNLYHPAPVFGLIIVIISVAYFTGRYDEQQNMIDDPSELIASLSSETRDKILFQSVSTHLERSSRLLTTVSMDRTEQSEIDITEQKWARQLLMSNRLFSKVARQSGQWRIVSLLDELEPILIEMANSSENTLATREQIKQRIISQKLVFKTKVFKTKTNNLI